MPNSLSPTTTTDITTLITALPDVLKAALVYQDDGAIREIHIVAKPDATPKRIVRSVEVLLHAIFGIRLDYRRIAVIPLPSQG